MILEIVSLLYGTLRKQASPTTDHGAEGTNCSGATPYKRENIVLGNLGDLSFQTSICSDVKSRDLAHLVLTRLKQISRLFVMNHP